jgi:thiol-disulfide isomerase/thioredoxin
MVFCIMDWKRIGYRLAGQMFSQISSPLLLKRFEIDTFTQTKPMKKIFLIIIAVIGINAFVAAQTTHTTRRITLDKNTVVKDSVGKAMSYTDWNNKLMSGDYNLRRIDPGSDSSAFILYRLTVEEKDKLLQRMDKPAESKFFITGGKMYRFAGTDITGKSIDLDELLGKIVVVNFWFIGCPPCRQEIPELNKIVAAYANDPDVVFVAIALDKKSDIKDFLKTHPYNYHIIPNGGEISGQYNLNLYPTNVVVARDGKVMFHSSGYGINTPYWIKKVIEVCKAQ